MSKRFRLKQYAILAMVVAAATMALFVSSAAGTTGAAYTSIDSAVDNPGGTLTLCLNGNGDNNCNLYTDKSYVWMNGGPLAGDVGDGTYFFAVLSPGGQPSPNDAATVPDTTSATPKNLSDDFDSYTNRTFTISGGAISYSGSHDFDPANNKIRLMPYSDTLNPGGVYIMALCQYDPTNPSTYPVAPSTCKYDAFKVRAGSPPPPNQVGSCFSGTKYRDDNKNGQLDNGEVGLQGWTITIDPTPGTDPSDDATTVTDADGNWSWCEPDHVAGDGSTISYTISETPQSGWRQTGSTVDQTIALGGASVVLNSTTTPPYTYTVTVPNNADATADGLNFGNIPQGTISGAKYYDSGTFGILDLSGSGPFSALNALISGWHISQAGDASNAITTGAAGVDANGYPDNFTGTLDPGTYTFAEVQATNGWVQTGNTSKQGTTTGNAVVTLNGDKTYSVTIPNDQPSTVSGLYFGNVCLRGGGGLTLGFWSNKNGQALETAADFTMLTGLNLRNANGSARDFTGTLAQNKSALNSWLLAASATNMAYMLSAQLTAMELNVAHGFVNPLALIYAPGATSADVNGFATVAAVMAEANTSLGLNGLTVAAGTTRTYQEALKTALDKANNNLNFVQSSVNTCPAPTFP